MVETIRPFLAFLEHEGQTDASLGFLRVLQTVGIGKLVEYFERYLNNAKAQERSEWTEVFIKTLESIVDPFCPSDFDVLSRFCQSKMTDWTCLSGGLQGCLLLLQRFPNSLEDNKDAFHLLVDTFYNSIQISSLKLTQRSIALEILQTLVQRFGEVLIKEQEWNLIQKTIESIDGEKDPRCLIKAWNVVQLLTELYKDTTLFSNSAEDLFDVVSVYFPIEETTDFEFDGKTVVTVFELTEQLNKTLTCSSVFAEFCLPLILEKLTSNANIPQLNALRCITLGSCNFPLESFIEYLSPLWKAIRQLLVMETVDFSIREAAIDAATALSSLLPTGEEMDIPLLSDLIFADPYILDLISKSQNMEFSIDSDIEGIVQLLSNVPYLSYAKKGLFGWIVLSKLVSGFDEITLSWSKMDAPRDTERMAYSESFVTLLSRLHYGLGKALQNGRLDIPLDPVLQQSLSRWIQQLTQILSDEKRRIYYHSSNDYGTLCLFVLHLNRILDSMSRTQWKTEFERALRWICGKQYQRSDKNGKQILTILNWTFTFEGFTSISIEEILSIPVLSILVEEQCFLTPNDKEQTGIDFRFQLLRHICHSKIELTNTVSDASKKTFVGSLLKFVSEEIPFSFQNAHWTTEFLKTLVSWLPTCPLGATNRSFLHSVLYSIFLWTRWSDEQQECGVFQSFPPTHSPTILWKFAVFCGMKNTASVLRSPESILALFESCRWASKNFKEATEDVQLWVYEVSASAAFHLVSQILRYKDVSMPQLDAILKGMENDVAQCSTQRSGEVILSCYCLKAMLCSSCSFAFCRNASNQILPHLFRLISKDQEDLSLRNDRWAEQGIEFLVSDEGLDAVPFTHTLGNCQWKRLIQRQRAFSICLATIMSSLENKEGTPGALLALGCVLKGAGKDFVKLEIKRVLPWMLILIAQLESEKALFRNPLIINLMNMVASLLSDPESSSFTVNDSIKHQILQMLMDSALFQLSHEVRFIAIKCLVAVMESTIFSKRDGSTCHSKVMELLRTAMDDKKRKVRKLAVRSRSRLEHIG